MNQLPKNIYFIGAGGIGMAALVRYALSKGCNVAGYDRTSTPLTDSLRESGADITFTDDPASIPPCFNTPDDAMLVYTPAVPAENKIFTELRHRGFKPVKRAVLLGEITRSSKAICVAGSHGKTTTSSMIAHILHSSPIGCNAFLGGVLRNYNSNLLLSADSPYSVAEADEYDRSFHQLSPFIAVVTSTDPDHLDIYGNAANYLLAFEKFTSLIRPEGVLLMHAGLPLHPQTDKSVRIFTYATTGNADFHADNITFGNGRLTFDLLGPDIHIENIELGVPVEINIDNAVAAAAAAHFAGASEQVIKQALATFMGAQRRFHFWLRGDEPESKGRVLIDDYAHSPNEIKASLAGIRKLFPGRKICAIFQPHLYTRTRDFANEFGKALTEADDVILTEIYPAREEPIPGVDSNLILNAIGHKNKICVMRKDLLNLLKSRNFDIVMTLGAADIDRLLPDIRDIMTR